MNIAFYTSEVLSPYDFYNINYLLDHLPEHNYSIVQVGSTVKKELNLVSRFKRNYYELRNGKNYFYQDLNKIGKFMFSSITNRIGGLTITRVDEVNDVLSERAFDQICPDIIIQAGAGILKTEIINKSKLATLNVHHGYGPEIRGIQSTFWCLYYGLIDRIGVTCHLIDEGIDTGKVVRQFCYSNLENLNFVDIQSELGMKGGQLLKESLIALGQPTALSFSLSEIQSCYFGMASDKLYNKLYKNNFNKVEELPSEKLKIRKKYTAIN